MQLPEFPGARCPFLVPTLIPWRKTDVRPIHIRESKKMVGFKIVDQTFCFCTGTGGVREEPFRAQVATLPSGATWQ